MTGPRDAQINLNEKRSDLITENYKFCEISISLKSYENNMGSKQNHRIL